MANLHVISGSSKMQNGEKHEIPGKNAAAKLAFKRDALVNAFAGTHELALAISQGKNISCQWVIVGDFNTLPDDMSNVLEDYCVRRKTAVCPKSLCRWTIDRDKRRDWLVSCARLADPPLPTVICQSDDTSHFSITGVLGAAVDTPVVAIPDVPRPEDQFLRDAVAALEIIRKARVEQSDKDAEERRLEEDERDLMSLEDAAEQRKKIPRISVDCDKMHVTVDGDDGKPNTVTMALALTSDGTWSTQTSPRGGNPRDAAGSTTDATGPDTVSNREEMDASPTPLAMAERAVREEAVEQKRAHAEQLPDPPAMQGVENGGDENRCEEGGLFKKARGEAEMRGSADTVAVPHAMVEAPTSWSGGQHVPDIIAPPTDEAASPPTGDAAPRAAESVRPAPKTPPIAPRDWVLLRSTAVRTVGQEADPAPRAVTGLTDTQHVLTGWHGLPEAATTPTTPRDPLEQEGSASVSSAPAAAATPGITKVSVEDDAVVSDDEDDGGQREHPAGAAVTTEEGPVFVRLVASKEAQEKIVAAVLCIRATVLVENRLDPANVRCTPWSLQKIITDRVKSKWWDQKPKDERGVVESLAAGKRDTFERTRTAYFRAAATAYFGSNYWYYSFVALGDVPAEMIALINRHRRETARKRVLNERTGVVHKVSQPKALREEAKREAKLLKALEVASEGRWIYNWYQKSRRAQDERTPGRSEGCETRITQARATLTCTLATSGNAFAKDLWDIAEKASELAGHPYQDRNGKWVNPKPPGKFESAVRMCCERHLKIEFPQ